MRIGEITELALGALKERKTRSILTILMVVVGSSLIVSLNGMNGGFTAFTEQRFKALASDVVFLSSASQLERGGGGGGPGGGVGGASQTPRIVLTSVIANNVKNLPSVSDVIPDYTGQITLVSQGKSNPARVLAIDMVKIYTIAPGVEFDDGSSLTSSDPSAMVLGENVARPPAEEFPFAVVGQAIQGKYSFTDANGNQHTNTRSFVVKGIMHLTGNPQVDNAAIILPSAANSLMNKGNKYDGIIVQAKSTDLVGDVQDGVKQLYGNNIGINTPQSTLATIQQFRSGTANFMLGIAAVALLVGAIGIITTLYTSVMERIREIGTMKAIGAKSKDVLLLFLNEATIIGIMGATIGIIVGIVGGFILTNVGGVGGPGPQPAGITPVYFPNDLAMVWFLSVGLSAAAGLYPAMKASRLPPIVALRRE